MEASKIEPKDPTILSVVVVNYRSWPDTLRLVASLIGSRGISAGESEIVLVDNDSGEPIPTTFLEPIPGLRVVLSPENGGFSAGVNAGWRASKGSWLLVLNPDVIPGDDLIEVVLGRIEGYENRAAPAPGVVGFGLRNPDGSRQPSVGTFPGLLRTAWEQLIPRTRRKYQPEWRLRPGPVDWVTGACMLVNRRLLSELGGMDEDFFLYHEEVALCRSARRAGWEIEYDPGVSVAHLRPLQNRAISPKMRVITRHSKLLYFRKHLPAWQFAALVSTVRLESLLRGALCVIRGRGREARSWKAVDRVARLLGSGADFPARDVRDLAEAVEEGDTAGRPGMTTIARDASRQTHGRSHGTRPIPPRKDGP